MTGLGVHRIGSYDPNRFNHIAHNGGPGIVGVHSLPTPVGVPSVTIIEGNYIDYNTGPGIVGLPPSPVTMNVPPMMSDFTRFTTGFVTGAPGERWRIDTYATPIADPTGEGEGGALLGSTEVTIGPTGRTAFLIPESRPPLVTAIATRLPRKLGPGEISNVPALQWSTRFAPVANSTQTGFELNMPGLAGRMVAGTGTGGPPVAVAYHLNGIGRREIRVFEDGFTGGVRVAQADFTGDGVPDVAAATGPGRATQVVILDGKTLQEITRIDPFEPSFTGGVFVATGDLDGDGRADLAVSPDEGGGPRVRVFSGIGFAPMADFFGIDDPNFRGGARVAIGDLDADGVSDLLVAAGFGGGPRVAGFRGPSLGSNPEKLFADFFVFEQALRNGAYVAAGDVNGDGNADVIAGGGPGGGPRVYVLSGRDLRNGQLVPLANFFAGPDGSRGGVRVATTEADGDGLADVVAGSGPGAVTPAYEGAVFVYPSTLSGGGETWPHERFSPFGELPGGVYVG